MSLEGVLVYKVKQVLEKWLKEHDQRILREFVEYFDARKKEDPDYDHWDYLEQSMKERNLTPQNNVSGETSSPKEELGAQKERE